MRFFILLFLILASTSANAETVKDEELCVEFFGLGKWVDGKCKNFPGDFGVPVNSGNLQKVLTDGVSNIQVESLVEHELNLDLSPLASSKSVHTLVVLRDGEIDLTPIQHVSGLRKLTLYAKAASALDQLTLDLESVVELKLVEHQDSLNLSALEKFPRLRVLEVIGKGITGQESLKKLTNLEHVTFELEETADFSVLSTLTKLKWLEVSGRYGHTLLTDIEFVTPLTSLRTLVLHTNRIEDLSPLSGKKDISRLVLADNRDLSDVSVLSQLKGLVSLRIDNTNVSDLTPIQDLIELQGLSLKRTPVSDLAPIAGLSKLWRLDLAGTQITDIEPLRELPLRLLNLRNTNVKDLSPLPTGLTLKR